MSLKISIVTPSFNQGAFLEETILSVLDQNYPNLEYIIIDGGSTDNSVEIIRKYESKLTYWISEKDTGQSDALNKGFKKCTGDIIAWLNSDDIYTPNTLEKINDIFSKDQKIGFIHGKSLLFGQGLKDVITGDHKHASNLQAKYLAYIPFPQPSSFFRSALLHNNKINEYLHYGMDYHFYLAAVLLGFKGMYVDEMFSHYRMHSSSKSNHDLLFAKDWAFVFSKLLVSLPSTDAFIKALRSVGLFSNTKEHFEVNIILTKLEVKQAVLEHLLIQLHYHYNVLEIKTTLQLADLINTIDPIYFSEKKLDMVKLKCRLPIGLIKVLRKLTR